MTLPRLLGSRRRRRLFSGLVAAGIVEAALTVAAALVVVRGYDAWLEAGAGASPASAVPALAYPVMLVAVAVALWALRGWQHGRAERLAQHYVKRVRLRLLAALIGAGAGGPPVRSRGPHMVRFASDLTAVRLWVAQGIGRIAVAGVAATAGIALLPTLDLTVGSVAAALVLAPSAAAIALGRRFRGHADAARRARNRVAANLGDKVIGRQVVRAYRHGRRELRRLGRQSDRLATAMVARSRTAGWLRAVPDLALPLATAGVLAIGPVGLTRGDVDVGALFAIVMVLGVLGRPLADLVRALELWHAFQVARARLVPALAAAAPAVAARPMPMPTAPVAVAFDQVALGTAVKDITAVAGAGHLTMLVGPNGAGKSALLDLAAGIARPTAGRVLIADRDLATIGDDRHRVLIGAAGPGLPLQRGSLARNLRYRMPRASEADVTAALDALGLDGRLAGDAGRSLRLDDGGTNLSDGERQAFALARALVGSPAVLVLDDPTRDLDPRTRAHLFGVLRARRATILAATHDPALARMADAIWLIADGRIVERGAPADLLAADTMTARHLGIVPARPSLVRASP